MKKIVVLVVLVIVALFLIGTDFVVNPFENWIVKNQTDSAAPRLQYSMAAYLYMVAQRQSRAVELYKKAFELFPGYPDESEARYRVGLYYESKRDYPKATETYQYIIQKWPDTAERLALTTRIERFKAYGGNTSQ